MKTFQPTCYVNYTSAETTYLENLLFKNQFHGTESLETRIFN